ncbi:Glutaredoxin-related protein 5, mitochondrial [Seminavis robusta]|uniref:Glutaredoxin-related protein 5, mitochondrial n=1 Tax=Seminavis robusta TaxID=568900 RepID=A0A9N8EGD5_9STRA|nr:Glutaredoxin-related protein 5, mitochondrial [Seminavis robusta]|eukprot:Sro905_g218530.1 Glutaredoxin-related protein 5, mitochondrial (179) ;mRNA; f:20954-21490
MSVHSVFGMALGLLACLLLLDQSNAFGVGSSVAQRSRTSTSRLYLAAAEEADDKSKEDALKAAIGAMYGDQPLEAPDKTQERIKNLIESNKVVLFMKGTKFFPQCGFSETATKILEALKVEFEAVDVLSDESIRQGIKEYSQWPTIPQLYINQEFIGGSDIMINMFESGELQEMMKES